jgi:hypothetical protein
VSDNLALQAFHSKKTGAGKSKLCGTCFLCCDFRIIIIIIVVVVVMLSLASVHPPKSKRRICYVFLFLYCAPRCSTFESSLDSFIALETKLDAILTRIHQVLCSNPEFIQGNLFQGFVVFI